MGRGRGKKGRGGNVSRSSGRGAKEEYEMTEMANPAMENYYKAQEILPESEWDAHLAACKRTLPTTFRITGSKQNALMVRDHLQKQYFAFLSGLQHEGKEVQPPTAIPWYPDALAYKLDVPKQVIRKAPAFKKFQRFLVSETDSGNLIRQEAVSMIPPLFMDVQSHHAILDMCAAPGSKTSQLIEYLHAKADEEGVPPTGLVVANDSEYKRAYMLVHQVKRLNSPNLVVTNHDATFIANFHNSPNKDVQKFDRVLADVPCSGDGTLRKNYNIWTDWSVKSGLSLHPTQVNCLRRGLQMLKVGGRLVYSTCSLNPIENEAVIAAVLANIEGAAHLVDVSDQLPALQRRPGLRTWKATDTDGTYIESIEQVKEKKRFPGTIFPPTEEVANELHLERCMRVYPHLMDTGGFFIAVIEKTKELTANIVSARYKPVSTKRDRHTNGTDHDTNGEEQDAKKMKLESSAAEVETIVPEAIDPQDAPPVDQADQDHTMTSQDPEDMDRQGTLPEKPKFFKSLNDEYFKFIAPTHPEILEICKYYSLPPSFPRDRFLSRNITAEPVRAIYFTSPSLKALLLANETRMRFVHGGVKMFTKQETKNLQDGSPESENLCKWRITNDAVSILVPYVGEDRKVRCSMAEFVTFMKHEYPRRSLFPAGEGTLMAQLEGGPYGCYLLTCDLRSEEASLIPEVLVVPIWKSKVTVQMMLARKDKEAIYTRMTGEELPLAVKKDKKESDDEDGGEPATEEKANVAT